MTAHRLSTIALAERAVLLEGGRIVADGSHEQLLAEQPRYVDLLARSGAVGDVPTDGGAPDDRPAGDEVVGRW